MGWGFHATFIFICNILKSDLYIDVLTCTLLFQALGEGLLVQMSLLVCEREVGELVHPGVKWGLQWGLLCGTGGRKELCMVSFHSFHINGIWTSRSKKVVRGALKSSIGVAMQTNASQVLLGTVKIFVGYPFSLYYCSFIVLYLLRLARPQVQFKVLYSLWD